MFGFPLLGPANMYYDNRSDNTYFTKPESTL